LLGDSEVLMLEKRFPLSVPSVLAILLFVAVSGMSPASSAAPRVPGPPPATGELEGYVRAVDGNTVDARLDGRRVGIEIIGIKAARGNTPCGRQATAYLQSLIEDGVTIEAETGIAHKKYWGMYHLQTLDGRSIADEMVAAGYARSTGQGKRRLGLSDLEQQARAAGRGCWKGGGAP
jgi:endonuclease YncB( thermonuclease family)